MTTITRTGSSTPTTPTTTTTGTGGTPPPATTGTTGTAATTTTQGAQGPTDGFETGAPTTTKPPEVPVYQQKWQTAVQGYQDKLTAMFVPTAEQLADGKMAPRTSADITPEMRTQLQNNTKDLFLSMPVGVLAPAAKDFLTSKGFKVGELENTALKDLGPVGGEVAKQLADKVKDASPAAYYGVAAAGAVAVGAYGYTKGSGALEKLGIKPEFKTGLFHDQVNVRAAAQWDARLANPNLTAGADGKFKINAATLSVGGNVNVAGKDFANLGLKKADAHVGLETENHGINASVNLGDKGAFTSGEVSGRTQFSLDSGHAVLGANGKVSLGEGAKITSASLSQTGTFKLDHDRTTLNTTATGKFAENGKYAGLDLKANADVRLSASGHLKADSMFSLDKDGHVVSGAINGTNDWKLGKDTNLNLTSKYNLGAGGEVVTGSNDLKLTMPHSSLGVGTDQGARGVITGHRIMGSYDDKTFSAAATANVDAKGQLQSATIAAGRNWGETGNLSGNMTLGSGGRVDMMGLKGNYTRDNFRLSGEVEHNFLTSTTTGALSAGYRPTRDLDIAVKGALNTAGESRIGVGVTWRF